MHPMPIGAVEAGASEAPVRVEARLCRWVLARVVARLAVVLLLVLLAHKFDARAAIKAYVAWVESLEARSLGEAALMYLLGGTVFSSISPTGYLPTFLAGVIFPWWLAWPLAYLVVNVAAVCNLVLVRGPCHPVARKVTQAYARLQGKSEFGGFGWLDEELRCAGPKAFHVVALVRLPYLWGGLFNYVFALSAVRGREYLIGNLIGLAPGALLFTLLGGQAQSLVAMAAADRHGKGWNRDQAILICGEAFGLALAVASLGIYFQRVWRKKALRQGQEHIYASECEERVSLLHHGDGEEMEPILFKSEELRESHFSSVRER